jgi:hypothetical protein
MIRRAVLVFALVGCAAVPVAAQQPAREPQGHSHGAHGHNDLDDVEAVLRMLTVYQMRHRAQHGRYAASLRELGLDSSRTVTVRITANGADGFAAVSASSTEECAIFSGRIASPRSYVARPNEVVCRPRT